MTQDFLDARFVLREGIIRSTQGVLGSAASAEASILTWTT